jgi:iron complex transport system substrate-binding protein
MPSLIIKYLVPALFLISSCHNRTAREEKPEIASSGTYVEYAKKFKIEKKEGYSILTIINPWQGAVDVNNNYWLVKRGDRIPAGIDTSSVIYVPVRRIICMSTTYLAMISALGEDSAVKGISGVDLIFNEDLREKVEMGEVADVGYEDNLNKELIIQIDPDLLMVYGVGSESSGYLNKIKELGYRTIFNADYLETDPLGKAEWIKVFGVLFCKEKEANNLFFSISNKYNKLKSFIREKILKHPAVLLGLPWKDTWFVSPGNSYMNTMISDAGGDYLWKDTRSELSMPYGIENVYLKAMEAAYWLNIGSVNNRGEITAIDTRLGDLPPFRNGKLFNNNNRVTIRGGNDYWESGAINPHIILKDIGAILHPELFPGYELFYYKKIN